MEDLLRVSNLSVVYRAGSASPHRAVDGISFSIAAGEAVGLMGESGCGKTSVALALLGLHNAKQTGATGEMMFRGQNLLALDERAFRKIRGAKIAMISQEPSAALCPVRRAGAQIADVLYSHTKRGWKSCRAEAGRWLERLGLEPTNRLFDAYPHQLSGGQLQRVALAQALICKPELLIADEPTAALDARSQAQFIELMRRLRAELRISILLISHTPAIQASLADRIVVMRAGRIVEEGGFEQMFRKPSDPYTRAMLCARAGAMADEPSFSRAEEYVSR